MAGREHAVVLGASMAGLVAARVLAPHYRAVTVVERDDLPDEVAYRRGVPQARHVHGLLSRGGTQLDAMFPGLWEEMVAHGAVVLTELSQMHFRILGHLLPATARPAVPVLQATRPLLESRVRARVAAMPNVTMMGGYDVVGPVATPSGDRVVGVRVAEHGRRDAAARVIEADLVVDALGRAGRSPAWLTELGYEPAPEDHLPIDLGYVSQRVRLPDGLVPERLVLVGAKPGLPVGVALLRAERDSWMLTVMGYGDQRPAPSREGVLALVGSVAPPHVLGALEQAEELEPLATHRFQANRRRRYERLRRFPDGLLVTGDALCSFNPVYGQGMTVAALQGRALDEALAGPDTGLARRFFAKAARPVGVAWQLSVATDLALPEIPGRRSAQVRATQAYTERVLRAAEHDPDLAVQFLKVIGLTDPPRALFRPSVLRKALAPRRGPLARGGASRAA